MYKKSLLVASALVLSTIESGCEDSGFKYAVGVGPLAKFGSKKIKGVNFTDKAAVDKIAGINTDNLLDKENDFNIKGKTGYLGGRVFAAVGALKVASANVFLKAFGDFGNSKFYLNDKTDLTSASTTAGDPSSTPASPVVGNSASSSGSGAAGVSVSSLNAAGSGNSSNENPTTNVGSENVANSILELKNRWSAGFGPEVVFSASDSVHLTVSAGPMISEMKQTLKTSANNSGFSKSSYQFGGYASVSGRMFFGEERNFFAFGEAMVTLLGGKEIKAEKVEFSTGTPAGDITFKHKRSLGGNVAFGVGYYHG